MPKIVSVFKNKSRNLYFTIFLLLFAVKMILDTYCYRIPHDFYAFSLYTNPIYRFQDFLLGYVFCLCVYDKTCEIYSSIPKIIQICIVFIYFICCIIFDKLWLPASYILLGLMMIYIISIPKNIFSRILGNDYMTILGNISFELFILHVFIIKCMSALFHYFKIEGYGIILWLMSLAFSILISYIFYKKPWKKLFVYCN